QLLKRTRVKGFEQGFLENQRFLEERRRQAYQRATIINATRLRAQATGDPRLRKINSMQAAIHLAILATPYAVKAGKTAIRWGQKATERHARLREILRAELPQQAAEQAINDTLDQIADLMNGRARAVERFVT